MSTTEAKLEALIFLAREIIQGLTIQQDALVALEARLVTIETELTKELPPSKTADVLKELVVAVNEVRDQMAEVVETVRDGMMEPEEDEHDH